MKLCSANNNSSKNILCCFNEFNWLGIACHSIRINSTKTKGIFHSPIQAYLEWNIRAMCFTASYWYIPIKVLYTCHNICRQLDEASSSSTYNSGNQCHWEGLVSADTHTLTQSFQLHAHTHSPTPRTQAAAKQPGKIKKWKVAGCTAQSHRIVCCKPRNISAIKVGDVMYMRS